MAPHSPTTPEVSYDLTLKALSNIRTHLEETPLSRSIALSALTGRDVSLKWDNKLITGSFKERGAVNFLCHLLETGPVSAVCAASAGNHALGLSFHARRFGIRCVLVMPKSAPLVKVQSCERNGAEIILHGDTFNDAFAFAQEMCVKEGYTFIPPFDHPLIVAGQASLAHELLKQSSDFDSIIVPVGGGGLLAGVITVLRAIRPEVFILGVQSSWAVMHSMSLNSVSPTVGGPEGGIAEIGTTLEGNPLNGLPRLQPMTIADGIAVKQLGTITGPIIRSSVDALVSVNEQETATALVQFLEREHVVVEGSAAVALAALNAGHLPARCKKPVLVVSGSNIDVNLLSRLLGREMSQRDRLVRMRASLPDRPGVLHFLSGVIANEGANILEVTHDRSFAREPSNVEITLILEVRDAAQRNRIVSLIEESGVPITLL